MPVLTRRSLAALLWVIGAGVFAAFVVVVGWRPIADALANAHVGKLTGMSLVTVAALWLRVYKWRIALGPAPGAIPLFWMSKAAGEFSPGRVGELSPLLLKRYRTPRIAAWIVLDRVLEMTATIGLGVAGILLIRVPNQTTAILAASLISFSMLAALYLMSKRALFEWLAAWAGSESRIGRALLFFAEAGSEIRAFRGAMPGAMVITLIAGFADVWAGMLLYSAFGTHVSFALMAAVKGLHAITSAIPLTPNATGVPYLTAAVLLHEVGGVSSEVLIAAIAVAVAITNIVFWLSALAAAPSLRSANF
ncbi:MAG: lysylphosphatidylglycerol synthase domain-containing protein [Candidatus Hydrogenedentes bacterium]|nr:lysylphosphatidylglycerol synthase domain-containing protein [Candidatus Hydrogenedentota bacterium]